MKSKQNVLECIMENEKVVDDKEILETISLMIDDEISLLESIIDLHDLNSGRGACGVLKRDMEFIDRAIFKYLYDDK